MVQCNHTAVSFNFQDPQDDNAIILSATVNAFSLLDSMNGSEQDLCNICHMVKKFMNVLLEN